MLKIIAVLLITIGGAYSCNEKEKPQALLANTKWKLIGFVDAVVDTIKMAKPIDDKCYLLTFNEDHTFSGVSSTNTLSGNYDIDYAVNNISLTIKLMTEINELFDGRLYLESLNSVQSFSLQENELRLYYNDKKKYLLYKLQ
jgi:heat shock protein HslJ